MFLLEIGRIVHEALIAILILVLCVVDSPWHSQASFSHDHESTRNDIARMRVKAVGLSKAFHFIDAMIPSHSKPM